MSVDKPIAAVSPAGAAASPDPDAREPQSDAALVRALLREAAVATIATTDVTATQAAGRPYASLVEVATSVDGQPLLLISRLARHTKNLLADPRIGLLVDRRAGSDTPLAAPRATLIGRARLDARAANRARFLRRHPGAAGYADFADFQFWSIAVESAHLVAGFGRIREVAGPELRLGGDANIETWQWLGQLADAEERVLVDIVSGLSDMTDGSPAPRPRLVGVDPEGLDVRRGGGLERVSFARPALTMTELSTMARQAWLDVAPRI